MPSCQIDFSQLFAVSLEVMDRRKVILIAMVLRRRRRRQTIKNQRQYWVHPILRVRYVEGAFYTLFEKLRENPGKFFNYFRMSKETFDYLVDRLFRR